MMRDTTQQGSSTSFEEILAQFPQRKILVLGDIMVDEYIWGVVSRISPEAPVPVVEVEDENIRLGGAANVVANIRALRGQADLVGVAGGDSMAERLLHEIEQIGVKVNEGREVPPPGPDSSNQNPGEEPAMNGQSSLPDSHDLPGIGPIIVPIE